MGYIIIAVDSIVLPERLLTEHFILLRAFFFKSNNFITKKQAEIVQKNQAKAKQHPEAERYLRIIHFLHSCYHPKLYEIF